MNIEETPIWDTVKLIEIKPEKIVTDSGVTRYMLDTKIEGSGPVLGFGGTSDSKEGAIENFLQLMQVFLNTGSIPD